MAFVIVATAAVVAIAVIIIVVVVVGVVFLLPCSVLLKTSLRTNMHQNKAQRPKRFFTYGSLVGHFVL